MARFDTRNVIASTVPSFPLCSYIAAFPASPFQGSTKSTACTQTRVSLAFRGLRHRAVRVREKKTAKGERNIGQRQGPRKREGPRECSIYMHPSGTARRERWPPPPRTRLPHAVPECLLTVLRVFFPLYLRNEM